MRRRRVLDADDIVRSLRRMAHEVVEATRGGADLVVVAIADGGVPVARGLVDTLESIRSVAVPLVVVDPTQFRDDAEPAGDPRWLPPIKVEGRTVVLVDDVVFTGRTARAALEAVLRAGRAQRVLLAVLVDRGHRELPIRPDIVGRNLPTARNEYVVVDAAGVWIEAEGR
ncbi:Uracil phosphoribosyltransferase [Acidimicrobium ferrooxidans DSM 10331]|uniref:Uracil phosphoribosyltransferase n=1 Tax=Acidimicrobium ferrooxidans (strain DSM 10331 / JCM 15462 / NBRC 103882 / ICP) TaxID=525909 RepID=C7M0W1_ACIFD|nr:bifunctional pyr operon transcriptional regulator/uracil phosphoribosyltransferase PyrR [Acidimicrobium ferrooxidans]ACU54619.1 Uracil phosphoribosyltransferase [Acidimicrobium ferrooxidans DSM 10331]